jgi:hypothetical protein
MEFLSLDAERAFERFEAFFVVERDRKQNGFHRIVVTLIGGGLRVTAGAVKKALEGRLVFAAQGAAEFCPVLGGAVNQLHECGNGAAHGSAPGFIDILLDREIGSDEEANRHTKRDSSAPSRAHRNRE